MPKIYRVTGEPALVRDPVTHAMVSPDPRMDYPADHPLVVAYPDMFAEQVRTGDGDVEQATRAPGERRGTRR